MGSVLKFLLFKPSGLIILGILIMAVGAQITFTGHAAVPDRAALTKVSGILENAIKSTFTLKGISSVSYHLLIKPAGGEVVKLTLSEREISEEAARSLLGRRVVALYSISDSGEKDVWELASGNTKVVDYAVTRQKREEKQAFEAALGPCTGGGGLLVSLLGIFKLFRQRRADSTA